MFPSDNYNHFPRYQGKFSGEEIDDLLDTVKTWKGGTNTGTGSLVFANPSVKSLQDWWTGTLSTTGVSESDPSKAISGPALVNWWNNKYISNTAISWNTITSDKVPSKGLIDGQLNAIKEQLNVLNAAIERLVPKEDVNTGTFEDVNTGTFDPTSDSPAGQKSLTDFIIEADLNSRYSRVASGNMSGAFSNLPSFYSGKFHLLRYTPFVRSDYKASYLFGASDVTEIDNSDELSSFFELAGSINLVHGFAYCSNLKTISAEYSLKKVTNMAYCFQGDYSLKTIKLRDFSVSFDISDSTQFEEADLVEIIGNLKDLTGKARQILTMGATNLAKLTDAEKAVAINKNWALV